ncbi:MAG TPA: hypothetical protein VJ596_10885 [Gemmatimonadaceae bacterium]|nr:hypothetical protein [Gemmatimonadaceae bacterium]
MPRSNRRCRIAIAITTLLVTIQWSGQLTLQGGHDPEHPAEEQGVSPAPAPPA